VKNALDLFRLDGRVAIVTGASAGIGAELVRGLADAGAKVVLAARRRERMDELAKELGERGSDALVVECDVTKQADVDRLVAETVNRFDGIDILVNNAGITEVIPAEDQTLEAFEKVVAVNLTGVFLCSQRVGRVMLEAGKGSIVNVASVLGLVGSGQLPQASYAASKGAVVNLTRELAAQWSRRGVRVNALAPAWFASEMTADMFKSEKSRQWIRSRTPMGRPGESHELLGPLIFLASDAASYVTGQIVPVDGGWTIV